ncbi:L-lysine 2,3-aminomutase [Colletotrichum orchidophilum]|uniref:L-lysine 2,3-aminomutase n=1 Tax=Colletotrichum orchidophilum TaxID=1209926 RepID=A0A1G4AWW4_9PEZI|nr:L-lysine 2,3-aminomutase [Colletotrichum orchidophilum]OHE93658.1 L-lysine 2,3-aminomutase [Colletotrichum orchidophilum]
MLSPRIAVRVAARFVRPQRSRGTRWIATPSRMQAAQAAVAETVAEEPTCHDHVAATLASDSGRRDEFWRKIPWWQDVSTDDFLSYRWSSRNMVERLPKLRGFLDATLPEYIPVRGSSSEMESRNELVNDIFAGIKKATMSVRLTPYVLSRIDWKDPRNDPIFRQFIPTQSTMVPDHPQLTLDSLHEEADSPVPGLVHRYPDKALFLPVSVCPTYCMFCTRSYAVGANTETVDKHSFKPTLARWEKVFQYIENTPDLQDIVVSGGDSYYLAPHQIELIGDRLISMPNIRRFRFASKGLAVCPTRILDPNDAWVNALVAVSSKARRAGKAVALHTHFNHPNEISWISEEASQKLFEAGVVVRNQTVLLRGINDDVGTMSTLIRKLADNNILPCDMVKMVEHLRTPLQTILDLESSIRGSIAGFVMPQFAVDLPGGGGKRLASTYRSYDRKTGISTYVAPAVTGRDKENKVYEYYDPVDSLPENLPSDGLKVKSQHSG